MKVEKSELVFLPSVKQMEFALVHQDQKKKKKKKEKEKKKMPLSHLTE